MIYLSVLANWENIEKTILLLENIIDTTVQNETTESK